MEYLIWPRTTQARRNSQLWPRDLRKWRKCDEAPITVMHCRLMTLVHGECRKLSKNDGQFNSGFSLAFHGM